VTYISLAPTLKIGPTLYQQLPNYQIPVGP
jgi:hypothetical protein